MPKLIIDGQTLEMPQGATILAAAQKLGIYLPRYCYHPALSLSGTCRMCVVEVEKNTKLQIACATEVAEGMVIHTDTPAVKEARKNALEFLLLNHPVDCPICDQAGECGLQDYYMEYGLHKSRIRPEDKLLRPKRRIAGKYLLLDNERCILCTRCVRFCAEVTGTEELAVINRGDASFIDFKPQSGVSNSYSLNIADLCPVGAFTSRDFRFKQRAWFLKKTASVCTGCATGCNIEVHHNENIIYRLMPRPNPDTNTWLCDAGRMSYKAVTTQDRLCKAFIKRGSMEIAPGLRQAAHLIDESAHATGPDSVAVLCSPWLSLEDNLALAELAVTSIKTSNLCLDYSAAQSVRDGILINTDPAPNANGLKLLKGAYKNISRDGLTAAINTGAVKTLVGEARAISELLKGVEAKAQPVTVVAALNKKELGFISGCVLPYAASFETEGHYINHKELKQKTIKAVEPPEGVEPLWNFINKISAYTGVPIRFDDAAAVNKKLSELN